MGVNIQTIKDIRFYLIRELEGIYPEQELIAIANIIIKTVFGLATLHHIYLSEQIVNNVQAGIIRNICNELKTGKPVQYVLGETIFYNCLIRLNSATLIPRPETEELVDLIIRENRGYTGNIIDFGTGSGCIAVALAANLPGAVVTGTDISVEALGIAAENAILNKVKVSFIKDDIFSFDAQIVYKAGIIVCNPPYVRNSEKESMNKNILEFEPHSALFVSDSDPLVFYKAVLNKAIKILAAGGKCYFEINEAMGKSMVSLLKSFRYTDIQIVTDMNGRERIIKGIRYV